MVCGVSIFRGEPMDSNSVLAVATVVLAVATLVLVCVTAYYAWQNHKMSPRQLAWKSLPTLDLDQAACTTFGLTN
jgi:hypothetical protein